MFPFLSARIAFCVVVVVVYAGAAHAQAPSVDDLKFFENKVRPVLVKHCYACHSQDAKEVGGKLLLDTRAGLRKGGESGPTLVEGKPDESLLVQALQYDGLQMPPDEPLPETVISDVKEWIRRGAPDPRQPKKVVRQRDGSTIVSDDALWSLQSKQNPSVPEVQNAEWCRDPLDRFVLARIEAANLKPAADAELARLVRRLYFDLLGLPPTKTAVDQFVADHDRRGAEAVSAFVDQLLASPQFGERWGRFWLDVARYGESNGNDGLGRNPTFPHAWRYRDYVIAAFNADVPYDRFLTEQIAGDLLPSDSAAEQDRDRVATGFLALGSKPAKAMNTNFEMDVVADQIDVIGRGILGLSVACARCHDHKFDPIPTRDYYALAGIFTSTETMWGTAAHEGLTAPATELHVLQTATYVPPPEGFVETVLVLESNTGKPKTPPKSKWKPGTSLAMGVRDRAKPADTKINLKGELSKLGEVVPRGFLSACEVSEKIEVDPAQSGRLKLAQWIAQPDHPLTARVMVNRIWQMPDVLDTWHDIGGQQAYAEKVYAGLKQGGRFAIVDHNLAAEIGPPKELQIASEKVIEELTGVGFRATAGEEAMPRHYMVIGYQDQLPAMLRFRRKPSPALPDPFFYRTNTAVTPASVADGWFEYSDVDQLFPAIEASILADIAVCRIAFKVQNAGPDCRSAGDESH